MLLQFNIEEFIRPLVSDIYNSSDEDIEIDALLIHENLPQDDGADSDIEIIACFRRVQIFSLNLQQDVQ